VWLSSGGGECCNGIGVVCSGRHLRCRLGDVFAKFWCVLCCYYWLQASGDCVMVVCMAGLVEQWVCTLCWQSERRS
jgi:hypothetical protein